MNAPELDPGYKFYPQKLNRFWATVLRPLHLYSLRRRYMVREIAIEGEEHVQAAHASGTGVLITPNHSFHGDALALYEVLHSLGMRSNFMAAWQVFCGAWGLKAWALRRMGVFSVDREGSDLKAFRQAVELLAQAQRPLVIFPEGEVYHINDRITPLREGAAMIALSAARRRANTAQPVESGNQGDQGPKQTDAPPSLLLCVPCAVKAYYLEDPTAALEEAMDALEQRIYWRPQRDRPIGERIYKYASAILSLKEREYTDKTSEEPLHERIAALIAFILADLERAHFGTVKDALVPVRIKELRRRCLELLDPEAPPAAGSVDEALAARLVRDCEDIHFVSQLFSYPGDYVAERPTIERVAETVHKFREDALGVVTAVATHPLRVVVKFGEPIDVGQIGNSGETRPAGGRARKLAPQLTQLLEQQIQSLLDSLA